VSPGAGVAAGTGKLGVRAGADNYGGT
jgi:hypothetical protein